MTAAKTPRCIVIAGPNGSGKTTFAREFLPKDARIVRFVNADLIAGGLSPLRPDLAALAGGRLFLAELDRLARARADFAFESTLSGLVYLQRLRNWKRAGYRVEMIYLRLASPQLALRRIAARVRQGGHNVPLLTCCDVLTAAGKIFKSTTNCWPMLGKCMIIPVTARDACNPVMKTRTKARKPAKNSLAGAGRALRRAARVARQTARRYGTPVYVWRDGKVVAEKP